MIDLISEINEKRSQIRIDSLTYDMDWIAHQIKSKELIINPEYQRMFQWNDDQQSKFIESLILNLPIPPIYFVEDEKSGKRYLLDGVQRICSYLRFVGESFNGEEFQTLREQLGIIDSDQTQSETDDESDDDDETNEDSSLEEQSNDQQSNQSEFRLSGCDIVRSLNGKCFKELDEAIQRRLKRKPIDIYSYSGGQDSKWIQYQMFSRMNSGGSQLNQQQIRNAKIRIIGSESIDSINNLAKDSSEFRSLAQKIYTKKTFKKKEKEMGLSELVLRLLAFADFDQYYEKEIASFLDDFLESVTRKKRFDSQTNQFVEFEYPLNERLDRFETTCKLLNQADLSREKLYLKSKFYFDLFHSLFIVLLHKIEVLDVETIKTFFVKLKNLPEGEIFLFKGGGKNTQAYHQKRIKVIERLLGF